MDRARGCNRPVRRHGRPQAGLAARAAPQLRHAPARRRRGPAQHPGAARPRERVEHPDLHSGRVRQAEKRLCAQSPSGLNRGRKTLETNVKPIELRELWRRYKTDGDSRVRERLVVAYSPLVKYVAGRTAAGLPPHVEEADLISYGLVGLISAIERFDLSREIKFETYAIMRIKGAIIDELRSMDWVPRSVRSRAREVERANAKLEHTLQRAPTDAGDRRRDGHHRRGTERIAAGDLALLDRRAGRAVERLGLQRRPGLADGHDRGPRRARPRAGARRRRPEGPDRRRRSPSCPSARSS